MNREQELALMSVLGILNDKQQAIVAATKEDDPLLQHAFRQLDPDAVDVPEPLRAFARELAQELEAEERIGAILRQPDPAVADSHAAFLHWDYTSYGGVVAYNIASSKADGGTTPAKVVPPYIAVDKQRLVCEQRSQDVPYGIVRVVALKNGALVASCIRAMAHYPGTNSPADDTWGLTLTLTELFPNGTPTERLDYYIQPACRDLLAWFPVAEVEALAATIHSDNEPSYSAIQQLLTDLKGEARG